MGIKISDLTSATSLTGSEEFPIVQAGNTKKTTINEINGCLNAIKVTLNSNSSFTKSSAWAWQIVPINNQEFLYGTGLSFNSTNHSVVIGENVSVVEVTYTITIAQGTPATTRRAVAGATTDLTTLANTTITPQGNITMVNGQASTYSCTTIIPVTQGQEIALKVQISDADTYSFIGDRCCLLVRVIKTGTATQTRSANLTMNTGSLVGSGEKSNLLLEDFSGDVKEEKDEEELPIEEIPLEEKTEVKESGENDELR